MKKLLICGDSFGELAGYKNHFTTSKYAKPIRGGNWHLEFKHWCELLADDVGMKVAPHAIGGAGVSSSSFVAFQQLLTDEYSALIYFVSHQGRTLANRSQSIEEWQQYVEPYILPKQGYLDQVYNAKQFPFYKYFKNQYHRNEPDNTVTHPQVMHFSAEELSIDNDNVGNIGPLEINPGDLQYLLRKPGYSYSHDSITAVLALKSLCEAKGIPLILASCFSDGVCHAINNMGINLKHFEFYRLEHDHNFSARHDYPSHYSKEEHELIYNEFKKQYPEYKKMFK